MLETVLVMKKGKKNQKTSLLLKLKKIIQMIAHQKSWRLSLSRCGTKTHSQTRADIPMSIRASTGVTSTFWGGHHYIRDNDSSASTATTAFGLNELSAKAILKKKSASRKRRNTGKGNRVLKGITNSILEEDEDKKTDYGDGYSSMTNLKKEQSELTPTNKSP